MNKHRQMNGVTCMDRLVRRLEWLRAEAEERASQAAAESAEELRGEAQETLRRMPGNLPHLAETVATKGEGLQRRVAVRHPAAPFAEFGTRHMPPRPFLQPAADRARKAFPARVQAAMLGLLKRRP